MKEKITEIKSCFHGQERFMMLRTLYRQNDYHPIMAFKTSLGLFVQIPIFIIVFHFLNENKSLSGVGFAFIDNIGKPDGLLSIGNVDINLLPIIMSVVSLLSAYVFSLSNGKESLKQNYVLTGLFFVLLYTMPASLVIYWTTNNLFSLIKNLLNTKISSAEHTSERAVINENSQISDTRLDNCLPKHLAKRIFISATLSVLTIITVYSPVTVYATDPSAFSKSMSEILIFSLQYLIYLFFITYILFVFLSERMKTKLCLLSMFGTIVVLLYFFVFRGDYGALDHFVFNSVEVFNKHNNLLMDLMVFSLSFLLVFIIVKYKFVKYFYPAVNILLLSSILLSVYQYYSISQPGNKDSFSTTSQLPYENDQVLSYSSDGENIVILMLDAYTGGLVEPMLKEYPQLTTQLDGFTWYPNTLSAADKTVGGTPAIRGGHRFRPDHFNELKMKSVRQAMGTSFGVLDKYFSSKGYELSVVGQHILSCDEINEFIGKKTNCIVPLGKYRDYWLKKTGTEYIDRTMTARDYANVLISISVFKSSPFSIKQKIYNSGYWRVLPEETKYNTFYQTALNEVSFLDSMSLTSNTNSPKNTIKYIRSSYTHYPWMMNKSDCQPSLTQRGQYDTAYCATKSVINWLTWLKSSNIYDNTKIIIVSDHGGKSSPMLPDVINSGRSHPHALMMVKDFGQRGNLKISQTFMSNADTLSIACSAIGGCEDVINDPTKYPIEHRELIYSFIGGFGKEKYDILSQYRVRNNIFEPENWTKIE